MEERESEMGGSCLRQFSPRNCISLRLGRTWSCRPRLIERLNEGLHRKLTLISAPAGFGKTTLVSEWVAGCRATGRLAVAGRRG